MNEYTLEQFLDMKTSAAASFNKDDSKVSFLSDVSGTYQLYIKDLETGEVKQVTSYEDRLIFARYVPKKDQVIFGKDVGGDEKTQFFLYDEKTGEIEQVTKDGNAIHRFGDISGDGEMITYISNSRNGKDRDVYVMNLATREEICVYQDRDWCDSLGFSPDGNKVVVSDRDSLVFNSLHLVDVQTKNSLQITSRDGRSNYKQPQWLVDNTGFFFVSNDGSDFSCVDFYNIHTDKISRLFSCEWDVSGISLSKDEKYLFITVNEGGYVRARLFETKTMSEIQDIGMPLGLVKGIVWSKDSSKCVFTFGSPNQIQSVWSWEKETKKSLQISPDYQSINKEALVTPELIDFKSHDGLAVPSFLFLPKGNKEATPVIILIHGGPEAQYKPFFNPVTQFLVSKGYAVAAPNVRGSSGYGKEYMTLDDKDKRLDSVEDIVYLKKYLETRKEIDSDKVILMGGSYGGYMVLANMAFYPEHWLAGIDIVGIANLVSFLENTAEWRRGIREAEYGSLKDDKEMLKRVSPINKVEDIKAPLFVIHGANDPRVPLSEAEQIESKLKDLGREVELLVYDDEGHGLAKRKNRLDAYSKMVTFLENLE